MSYFVALADAPSVPTAARMSAEIRYITTLEQVLGGSSRVEPALRASLAAREASAQPLSDQQRELAARWLLAADAANMAALGEIGVVRGARFEVRAE